MKREIKKIILKNVRLSFPSIFKKAKFNDVEGKYEATLLIDKNDTETKRKIDEIIANALKEAKIKVPTDKICLKDGDDTDYTGYAGHWYLKASNKNRPTVLNRDKTPLTEDDNVLYGGCYVNAVIDFWIQNNNYGKRVNANLHGIQFSKDGEPFGNGVMDVMDDFDTIDDGLDDL